MEMQKAQIAYTGFAEDRWVEKNRVVGNIALFSTYTSKNNHKPADI